MTDARLCWLDVRGSGDRTAAVTEEALHRRIDGIVADNPAALADLPPTVRKILLHEDGEPREDVSGVDVVIVSASPERRAELSATYPDVEFGRYVEVHDATTLEEACEAARTERWCVLRFRDPTKIPLEIVIAAAAGRTGTIVTVAEDVAEARVVFGCLELGSDGVLMPGRSVGDASELQQAAEGDTDELALTELEVVRTTHIGMGDRACVDTCSYLGRDEGILVGSRSKGMVLCVSETHPLPYMPTRPFRVNAGAIHSYTLSDNGRTNYLSELGAGSTVLAVDTKGHTRRVSVGRVKIETRPLISVDAVAPNGLSVNLILQDDWHVRVLGPDGVVLNSTELAPGDRVLGYLPESDRHVGYPIDEFCLEQ